MIEEDLIDMGQKAYDNGNYDLAIVYYRRAIEANPSDPDVVKRLGHVFYVTSDFQSAAGIYRTAIRYSEDHGEEHDTLRTLHICLCEACLRLGYLEEAQEQVTKAAQLDAGGADLHTTKGNVHLAFRQYNEALSEFEKAISLNPNSIYGYLGKAKVYQKQSQFIHASETLTVVQNLAPEDFNVEVALGNLATSNQRFESALKHYQRANDLAPQEPVTMYSLGAAYLNLANYDTAKKILEDFLEKCPDYADALYSLAVAEMEKSNETRAISLLNSAIRIDPDNVSYYALLTKAYFTLCKFSKGFRAASMARKLHAKQKAQLHS